MGYDLYADPELGQFRTLRGSGAQGMIQLSELGDPEGEGFDSFMAVDCVRAKIGTHGR